MAAVFATLERAGPPTVEGLGLWWGALFRAVEDG